MGVQAALRRITHNDNQRNSIITTFPSLFNPDSPIPPSKLISKPAAVNNKDSNNPNNSNNPNTSSTEIAKDRGRENQNRDQKNKDVILAGKRAGKKEGKIGSVLAGKGEGKKAGKGIGWKTVKSNRVTPITPITLITLITVITLITLCYIYIYIGEKYHLKNHCHLTLFKQP